MTRLTLRAAVVCLLAGATAATTYSRSTTNDLVHLSRRVCCARCESVEARLDPSSGIVFTHVRLRLLEDIKGRDPDGRGEGSILELRLAGGRAAGVETRVRDMPSFKPGAECVLFLGKRNRLGYPVVVQARRGAIDLRRGGRGERRLARTVTGFPDLDERRHVTLDEFRGSVRKAVRKREQELAKQREREREKESGKEGPR